MNTLVLNKPLMPSDQTFFTKGSYVPPFGTILYSPNSREKILFTSGGLVRGYGGSPVRPLPRGAKLVALGVPPPQGQQTPPGPSFGSAYRKTKPRPSPSSFAQAFGIPSNPTTQTAQMAQQMLNQIRSQILQDMLDSMGFSNTDDLVKSEEEIEAENILKEVEEWEP